MAYCVIFILKDDLIYCAFYNAHPPTCKNRHKRLDCSVTHNQYPKPISLRLLSSLQEKPSQQESAFFPSCFKQRLNSSALYRFISHLSQIRFLSAGLERPEIKLKPGQIYGEEFWTSREKSVLVLKDKL